KKVHLQHLVDVLLLGGLEIRDGFIEALLIQSRIGVLLVEEVPVLNGGGHRPQAVASYEAGPEVNLPGDPVLSLRGGEEADVSGDLSAETRVLDPADLAGSRLLGAGSSRDYVAEASALKRTVEPPQRDSGLGGPACPESGSA
ncbi:hypothetical protein THAOC_12478, partial [Thalassiosira oceanica]